MKLRNTLLALCILYVVAAYADDYKKCTYHYFKGKKVSTSECYDDAHRFGKARAYNMQGQVIYEKEIRTVGGSSHVEFSYYDNGAVKKASWHSAPDGGIQWYNTVTTFSEDGKVTGETENNYDHSPVQTMQRYPGDKGKKDSAHTAYCAVIYASEFWYVNTTRYTVIVTADRGAEHYSLTLKPGATAKGGQLILAEQFDDPSRYYKFSVMPANSKLKKKLIVIPSDQKPQSTSKEVKRYYFEVRRIV